MLSIHSRQPGGHRLALAALVALAALPATPALAQPPGPGLPTPRLLLVTPPGGRLGSTLEVTFTGTDLEEPEQLLFSHPGIQAEPVAAPTTAPPPPPPDPKKKPRPRRAMGTPVVTRFKVTVSQSVPVGAYDVRLVNKWGVSNPRTFTIGDLAEVQQKEPNNDVNQAQRVEMGTTVNGIIDNPTDVDYYVFAGKKGQRVVCSCLASSIDSRFHPGLEIYDARGKELAASRDYHDRDAVADCILPEDGDYYVRLYQFTHTQGSPEHFYRLSISTAPWIDAIFPCVLEAGKATPVTIYGRNLPGGKIDPAALMDDRPLEKATVTITAPSDVHTQGQLLFNGHIAPPRAGVDGFEYRLRNEAGSSNPFLLTVSHAPVVFDNGANDTPETAQEITLPCEIAGQVEKRRDRDWYTFTAKKGAVYTVEVLSERIGSSCSGYFVLRDAKNDLKESDENNDILNRKFYYRSDDPTPYRFTVPADGKYQLLVASRLADTVAGPRHFYRVRITPEEPDFRLVAMSMEENRPDAPVLLQDGDQGFTVFALRKDGFNGPITLSLEGLPKGVTCSPQVLGSNVRETIVVVHAEPTAAAWTGTVKIKGTATIGGREMVREARPAAIVWPVQPGQGIPTLTRLTRSLYLAVRPKAPFRVTLTLEKPTIAQGDKGSLGVKVERLWSDFKAPLTVQALATELPPGLAINNNQPFNLAANAKDSKLPINVQPGVPPGTYNIVLRAQGQVPFNKDPAAKQKPNVFAIQPTAPVALTILPKALATLALSNGSPSVKAGQQVEVVVRVNRLVGYQGDFRVEVVLPKESKGVQVADGMIPAGKNEGKLVVKAESGAAPGQRANLIVRATGTYLDRPVAQEIKLNVNVVK